MLDLIIEISIPLFILFVFALAVIFFLRIVFKLLLLFLAKRYKTFKQRRQEKYKKENIPSEEELMQSKKKQKEQLLNIERLMAPQGKIMAESRVVGIAKPIGFWTSLILGQQLTYLVNKASVINSREHKGFWTSLIEAQARGMGRRKGRML